MGIMDCWMQDTGLGQHIIKSADGSSSLQG